MSARAGAASPYTTWTQEARDEIAGMLRDGLSASQIGKRFDVSRNAIIGLVRRDKTLSEIGFARRPIPTNIEKPKISASATRKRNIRGGMVSRNRLRVVKPEPAIARATFGAPQTAGIPLTMFNGRRCKWPINDGGPFLFCGEVTKEDRPYCPFHATAAVGQGTESERSATRSATHISRKAA